MARALLEPDLVGKVAQAGRDHALCDACLGRLAARVETGFANLERGRILREGLRDLASTGDPTLRDPAVSVKSEDCEVCLGLLREVPTWAEICIEALRPFQFQTYLIGSKLDPEILENEVTIRSEAGLTEVSEALNTEINREVGKRVGAEWPDARVDFRDPNITAIVDTRFDVVALQHGGLFIGGNYIKNERGIPQTKWIHTVCHGQGCLDCGGAGKLYPTSVQELIEAVPMEASGATLTAFHGAGREDIDARAIGTGRPFILELRDPRRRDLAIDDLERAINAHAGPRVEVRHLRFAQKADVARLKEFRGTKTYRALVDFAHPPAPERFKKGIESLRGAPVVQRTPSRVEHRRADKLRERRVLDVVVEEFTGPTAVLRIHGDAGLYIKELVSGDEGRTKPSLADLVGVPARVRELDVLAVESDESPQATR
ncbi:MAG: tRNA pseudouridine(54/55) synthase Pus10 [Thermoplasmatota archaeon]